MSILLSSFLVYLCCDLSKSIPVSYPTFSLQYVSILPLEILHICVWLFAVDYIRTLVYKYLARDRSVVTFSKPKVPC
jgi:hypothetical protein